MKKVKIEIEAGFGSKFQEENAKESLLLMLKAWRFFVNGRHKKNLVTVRMNKASIQTLDFFFWE